MTDSETYGYMQLSKESFENIRALPNLTFNIPEKGYNFRATCFVCEQAAAAEKNCAFLDTSKLLAAEDEDRATEMIINACLAQKTIVGEIPVSPEEGQFLLLDDIMRIARQTLSDNEYDNRRLVVPLTVYGKNKESHGVALCLDADKKTGQIDIIIAEQHAFRDGGALDYSQEIGQILRHMERVFTEIGVPSRSLQNSTPICREKGVCGIVSAEVCRRLLAANEPAALVSANGLKISADEILPLHRQNAAAYQRQTQYTAIRRTGGFSR